MRKCKLYRQILAGVLASGLLMSGIPTVGFSMESLPAAAASTINNPIIWSDVPDDDIIRVGDTYYMVSTTMFFSPGAPIMKSKDLANWEICNYVFDTYANGDVQNLTNGKNDYSHGQWATSLRYNEKKKKYYAFFGSYGSGKSYICSTDDIENGEWSRVELNGMYHDASILFDDDGRNYLVSGAGGTCSIKEFNEDMTGWKAGGLEKQLFKTNFNNLAGEGWHIHKINGYYYILGIAWPSGHGRLEFCYRSKSLTGNWESKTLLDSGLGSYGSGVAQGGLVDTPDGKWYGLMFQDHGAVGRIPVLVPVNWQNDWPMMGVNGKAPITLDLGTDKGTDVAGDDSFDYATNDLALEWSWNHNPDNTAWSVTERPGWLRLKNKNMASHLLNARNTLTMRTEGPACSSYIKLDTTNMKAGDYAGLSAFQLKYGCVGVYVTDSGQKKVYMSVNSGNEVGNSANKIVAEENMSGDTIFLKVDFKFANVNSDGSSSNNIDKANFYYSYNGEDWTKIGSELSMTYDLKLFTGYRCGIYSYPTKSTGGYADIDFYEYDRTMWNGCNGSKVLSGSPLTFDPDENGYYFHHTFEEGTESWTGRGSAKLATSKDQAFEGSASLYTSGREAAWNGAAKKLNRAFVPGTAYSFSANVRYDSGSPENIFHLTLQYTGSDGEVHYDKIDTQTVAKGEWVQLSNQSYTLPEGASEMIMYVETAEDSDDFYVDDVIGAVDKTEIKGAGKSVSHAIVQGDVNGDGVIDVFDLGLAKRGMLSKFSNKSDEKCADIDGDGTVTVKDIIALTKYIHGIAKFPTVEKPTEAPTEAPTQTAQKSSYNYPANITYHEPQGKDYTQPAAQSGKVTKETYNIGNGQNTCLVYTPPGYDSSKKYNVLYLMHGGGENENTIFNEFKLNNILDNMIANGELDPLIVVTPNFNKATAQTFYKEWRASLIPFIEKKYSTYAGGDVAEANLKATRYHRAYGGFSMGSASTWAGIVHGCMEICAYWMPLSGDNWEGNNAFAKSQTVADEIDRIGLKDDEFFIIASTGSDDIAYPNMKPQYEEMHKNAKFKWGTDLSKNNIFFLVAPGKTHWWGYVRWYIYDTLPIFFHEHQ